MALSLCLRIFAWLVIVFMIWTPDGSYINGIIYSAAIQPFFFILVLSDSYLEGWRFSRETDKLVHRLFDIEADSPVSVVDNFTSFFRSIQATLPPS